jgi:O-antigen ligase/tetratricopeptide (TPR) repeat protein
LCHSSFFLLLLFPGLSSLYCLFQDLWHLLAGPGLAEPDFLDAGGGQPFSILLIRMLCCLTLVPWLLERREVAAVGRTGSRLAALLLVPLVLSAGHADAPAEAWSGALSLGLPFLVYQLTLERLREERIHRLLPQLLALSGGLAAWSGLGMYWLDKADFMSGGFFQQNMAAGYLVMVLPVTLALYLGSNSGAWLFCAAGEGGALLLTASRAGWGAGLVAVGLFALWAGRRHWKRLLLCFILSWALFSGLGSAVAGQGLHLVPPQALVRAENTEQKDISSVMARRAFYQSAWRMWLDHPLLGVGINCFARYYPQYQQDFRWYSRFSHSLYLDWLAEGGAVASLVFLAWLCWTGGTWGQALRRQPSLMQAAFGLGMAGSLVHAAVDVDWKFMALPVTFCVLAAAAVMGEADREALPEGRPGASRLMGSVVVVALAFVSIRGWAGDHDQVVGAFFLQHGRTDTAVMWLKDSLRANPWKSDACEGLVDAYLPDPNGMDAAWKYARHGVAVDPHRAVDWDRLAQVGLAANDVKTALDAEGHALALDDVNFPDFYNRMALLADRNGHARLAERWWQAAVDRFPWALIKTIQPFRQDALRPQVFNTFMQMGGHFMGLRNFPGALRAYLSALAIDPDNLDALGGAAVCHDQLQQYDPALILLERARRLAPTNARYPMLEVVEYQKQGNRRAAQQALEDALKLDPKLRKR